MWNDWLSSLNGPSNEQSLMPVEMPEPLETPRRFANPAQIEKLQALQSQHQQLQVQQLHLLSKQYQVQRDSLFSNDSTCEDSSSSASPSPMGGVSAVLAEVVGSTAGSAAKKRLDTATKKEDTASRGTQAVKTEETDNVTASEAGQGEDMLAPEVWQQFHALQAQQWAQALNQARIAKRQSNSSSVPSTPLSVGIGSMMHASATSLSGGKRCKAYAAPKGVWKNNGGYNATIYVHKRRIYGPIRRDLSDAIEDRKEMEDALRELTAIHNSPEDAAILEVEMREVVAGLRNRATPGRFSDLGPVVPSSVSAAPASVTASRLLNPVQSSNDVPSRKRLRLVGNSPQDQDQNGMASPDVLGPFASPLQVKHEHDDGLDCSNGVAFYEHSDDGDTGFHMPGFTPSAGPVYGSPTPMFGSGGLLGDDQVDMLPDSGLNSIWG